MATLASPARRSDTALDKVRDKVLAGRRLAFEDGVALYRTHDLLGLGTLANQRARAEARRRRVLRVEHAHQPHERLRGDLRLLRLRGEEGRAARLHDGARRHLPDRLGPLELRCARSTSWAGSIPTCRGPTSPDMMKGIKTRAARHPRQGLHRGRDLLLPPPLPDERGAGAFDELKAAGLDSMPGGGAEIFANETRNKHHQGEGGRRRSGSTSCARRTAWGSPRTPRCSTGTSSRSRTASTTCSEAARAAGRDGRLRDVHPPRLPALGGARQ